ncbi:hypothetical protein PROFUN_00216 [Planoprotostelium fungivorum]|uniref:ADP-dependent glucokinase n=1 Tax=Planoprotostelium fungivorum TaxID=1890364 RepID=A0A2P6NXW0_9EUKA|nr:hypothetical protein PROFUN_00216 [Planoprotostelium fungivorum]
MLVYREDTPASMKTIISLSVLFVLLAIFYPLLTSFFLHDTVQSPSIESQVLGALLSVENISTVVPCGLVAVGYNSNLDLIVNALDLMGNMGLAKPNFDHGKSTKHPAEVSAEIEREGIDEENKRHQHSEPPATWIDAERLSNLTDFRQVFGYFFQTGSAAERFADADVWSKILTRASQLEHKIYFTGGNAGLIANRFAQEGCKSVILGGAVGGKLSELLHPSVVVPQRTDIQYDKATARSNQAEDEVHLIMEYPRGAHFNGLKAPRANRFIVHSDTTNAELKLMQPFHTLLTEKISQGQFPQVVVISGFHLLDVQTSEMQKSSIDAALSYFTDDNQLPRSVPIHFELASMKNGEFIRSLAEKLLPRVDSIGLNEQELGSFYLAMGGKRYTLEQFAHPEVRTVLDALQFIYNVVSHTRSGRHVTRIHFHCLQYHILLTPNDSKDSWGSSPAAVTAGSLTATRQACDNDNIQQKDTELQVSLSIEKGEYGTEDILLEGGHAVHSWKEGQVTFSFAPVLVCKVPLKTVGLGDAISAVGLLRHLPFTSK